MSLVITRRSPHSNVSLVIPFAAKAGTFVMVDTTTPANAALGSGDAIGVLTRDVVSDLTVTERAVWPGRLELPFIVGQQGSVERLDAFEAEGTDHLVTSGTGALASNTALGTKLSVYGGKVRVAQTGDREMFRLREILTPEEAGALRIAAEAIMN